MNPNYSNEINSPPLTPSNPFRISWGAITAGVVITLVVQLLFTLLGAGIGAASIQPLHQGNPGEGLGIGSAIWLFVSALVSMYIGAGAAGHFSAGGHSSVRRLHGILTWGATTVIGFVLLATSLGAVLGGAGSMLGGATVAANRAPQARTIQANAPGVAVDVNRSSSTDVAPTGRDPQLQAQDEQQARRAADVAARRVSQASLWSFFVLVCSGIVAALAGNRSKPWGTSPVIRQDYGGLKTQPAT